MAIKVWLGDDSGNEGDYSVAANWSPSGVPGAGDDVIIPAGSPSITAGLAQSGVAIGDFIVEPGYTGLIGSATAPLAIDPDLFDFAGEGLAFIDLGAAAIGPVIRNTARAQGEQFGLELDGSAMTTIDFRAGALRLHNTATAATIEQHGGRLHVPVGATVTNVHALAGNALIEAALTLLKIDGGSVVTDGSGAIATLTINRGRCRCRSTGTITTANADGGLLDFLASNLARTVTTLNARGGSVHFDPSIVTITNAIAATRPIRLQPF